MNAIPMSDHTGADLHLEVASQIFATQHGSLDAWMPWIPWIPNECYALLLTCGANTFISLHIRYRPSAHLNSVETMIS